VTPLDIEPVAGEMPRPRAQEWVNAEHHRKTRIMALITWGPKLEIGIGIVDSQHRRLVDLINQLNEAIEGGRGVAVVGETLEGLIDYTHTHFRTEEDLLKEHNYEDYDLHRREHRIFTDQIEIYRDRLDAGSLRISSEVMEYMRGWLLTHIGSSDRAYIRTLKDAGVA
jgi:hemerythrin-like metal-binding protein